MNSLLILSSHYFGQRLTLILILILLCYVTLDDLDLHVMTPVGTHIYFSPGNIYDPITGGELDKDDIPDEGDTDRWVENINFPLNGSAPDGEYTFWVHLYNEFPPKDPWSVAVYVDGELQAQYNGIGNSHDDCGATSCSSGYKFMK